MSRRRLCLVVVCSWTLWLGAAAQAGGQPATTSGAPGPETATSRDYRVGPGDLLSLRVFGLGEFDQVARVSNSGRLHVRSVGVVKVADLTVSELEAEVARLLREKGMVKEPWVQARVEQYRAQPVYILGEVMNPGQFIITDEMYVTDLITLAAGLNEVANPIGYLYRRKTPTQVMPEVEAAPGSPAVDVGPTADEAIEVHLRDVMEGLKPDLNLRLQGGDVLYVPQRRQQRYYVVGDVNRAGAFTLDSEKPLLLSQAIAKAGGPMKTAKTNKGVIVRFDVSGRHEELHVDFKAILMGRKPDVPVQPDDIIFVPGSKAKTLAYGLLGIVPTTVTGAIIQSGR